MQTMLMTVASLLNQLGLKPLQLNIFSNTFKFKFTREICTLVLDQILPQLLEVFPRNWGIKMGMAVDLELAKALKMLIKQQWKKRTMDCLKLQVYHF